MTSNSGWGHFDRMLPKQIKAIIDKTPIAYLPWGALEYHGNHNPTGLDTHKAFHLCIHLARESGGLIFPPINIAANLIKSYPGVDFPKHSIEFSNQLVRQVCEEYLEQLVNEGFKIIVLLSGHAGQPHLNIFYEVANIFNEKYKDHYVWALAEFDVLSKDLLEANHSAMGETSLEIYFEPDLVDLGSLPRDREITLKDDAVSGKDPRKSSKEHGEKIVEAFVLNASKRINRLKKEYLK